MRVLNLLRFPVFGLVLALSFGWAVSAQAEPDTTSPANAAAAAAAAGDASAAAPDHGDQAVPVPSANQNANDNASEAAQPDATPDAKHAVKNPRGEAKTGQDDSAAKSSEAKPGEAKSGEAKSGAANQADADAPNPQPKVVITVDKSTQRLTVAVDGVQKYEWPVSTGRLGYSTPSGTYTPTSMNEVWYSKQWDNAPMPHAIFFMKDGHAIHGSYEVKTLGKPVSHGCVRIAPQNATLLYNLVKETGMKNTQVVLTGVTPGGEAKVANQPSSQRYADERNAGDYPPWFQQGQQGQNYYQPQRHGLFGRLFGGPQPYDGPQGYYYRRGY